jgi:hypothetical protein
MESFTQWFQEWAEACSYAQECVPTFPPLALHEPYTALGSIAAVSFLLWWVNERRLTSVLAREANLRGEIATPAAPRAQAASAMFDQQIVQHPTPSHKAA